MKGTIWITMALFDGKVVHSEEVFIKAHSEYESAWLEAQKNVHSARDAGYSGTGTAIFEVEIDGAAATVDVLVGDKR